MLYLKQMWVTEQVCYVKAMKVHPTVFVKMLFLSQVLWQL